jgi:hypothetical protein
MAEKQVDAPAPPPPKSTLARSVEEAPININAGPGGGNNFTFWLASVADTFEPWGRDYVKRDQQLRDFFHSRLLSFRNVPIRRGLYLGDFERTVGMVT